MNQGTLVKLGRSLFDAMTAHDLSTWEADLATDFVADYPCAAGLGREEARAYNAPFVAAFPDLLMNVERIFVQGDTVVVEAFASGTFSAPLAAPDGIVQPTGAKGGIRLVMIADLRDGKIVRERTFW